MDGGGGSSSEGGGGSMDSDEPVPGGSIQNEINNDANDDNVVVPEGCGGGNEINDEMPYVNWALRPEDEPLPEHVINVMAQVFQNDMVRQYYI